MDLTRSIVRKFIAYRSTGLAAVFRWLLEREDVLIRELKMHEQPESVAALDEVRRLITWMVVNIDLDADGNERRGKK